MSGRGLAIAMLTACACAQKCPGDDAECRRIHDPKFAEYGGAWPDFRRPALGVCVTKVGVKGAEVEAGAGCNGNVNYNPSWKSDGQSAWSNNGNYYVGWCKDNLGTGKRTDDQQRGMQTLAPSDSNANTGKLGDCGVVHKLSFAAGNMYLEYKPDFYGPSPDDRIAGSKATCQGGMFLPLIPGEFMWGREVHIILYFLALIFCFLGVAIVADVFMAAIEVITAKTRKVSITDSDGKLKEIEFQVWNETIANLTLMALGSSAPEILLSVIETMGTLNKPTEPGGLGPGTIVGSAAFNLLAILAICVYCIPKGEKRDIKELEVFTVTAIYSVWAYVWLYLVVKDNEVTITEAIITFLFFPLLVAQSFYTEKRGWLMLGRSEKVVPAAYLTGTGGMGASGYGQGDSLESKLAKLNSTSANARALLAVGNGEGTRTEQLRRERELQQQIAKMAMYELQQQGKTSALKYRMDARRGLTGRTRCVAKVSNETKEQLDELNKIAQEKPEEPTHDAKPEEAVVRFNAPAYAVYENAGKVEMTVVRSNCIDSRVSVQWATSDGTAIAGEDYDHARGTITFEPGQTEHTIQVTIIDDNEFEPDEDFYVTLRNAKDGKKGQVSAPVVLPRPVVAVTILNDDLPGTFSFESATAYCEEKDRKVEVKINRTDGCDSDVKVFYKTVEGSAKAGDDYVHVDGTLVFKHGETSKTITIEIVEDDTYEKAETFTILFEIEDKLGVEYGEHRQCIITIAGTEGYADVVNQVAGIMQEEFDKMTVETTSWTKQFKDAMTVAGDPGEDADVFDYVMHLLTFGWKVVFACIPPTSYAGGWATFFIALAFVGLLTGFVADVAGIFGCLIGLPDTITAITFVALGTSLPDTFASKTAAIQDPTADASIGNVTGSNSVNVFLGLGLPWLIATIAHSSSGYKPIINNADGTPGQTMGEGTYAMLAGDLGLSVIVFCACAIVCIGTIYIRRFAGLGELGGPEASKKATTALFLGLWLVYVLISSLKAKRKIDWSV